MYALIEIQDFVICPNDIPQSLHQYLSPTFIISIPAVLPNLQFLAQAFLCLSTCCVPFLQDTIFRRGDSYKLRCSHCITDILASRRMYIPFRAILPHLLDYKSVKHIVQFLSPPASNKGLPHILAIFNGGG